MKEYDKFIELKQAPYDRMKHLTSEVERLTEATRQAKKMFQEAEGNGDDSDSLFTSWQEIEHELKLNRAKLEAVTSSIENKQHTKDLKQSALDLAKSCHKDSGDLQKQKLKIVEELKDLQHRMFEKYHEINQLQAQQQDLKEIVEQAREITSSIEPVSPNLFIRAEQLPLVTVEQIRTYNYHKSAGAIA